DRSRLARVGRRRGRADVAAIATGIVDDLRARDPRRAVTVSIEPQLDARADARLVRALLENLLGNAWKFTAPCDRAAIDLGVRRDGDDRVFFVRDNGVGFD